MCVYKEDCLGNTRKCFIAFGDINISERLEWGWEQHLDIMTRVIREETIARDVQISIIEDLVEDGVDKRTMEFGFVCNECGTFSDKGGRKAGE